MHECVGPYLHWADVRRVQSQCSSAIAKDKLTFGIQCTSKHLNYHRIAVEYSTDISRQKEEAAIHGSGDFVVIYNATLLLMEKDSPEHDVLHEAILIVSGGKIDSIIGFGDAVIPASATTINAQGGKSCNIKMRMKLNSVIHHAGYVVPGFIDVHAHWNGAGAIYPGKNWELETFLAYGVTTLHKYVFVSTCAL